MFPGRAAIAESDEFLAGNGTLNPAAFPTPNLPPPNRNLGDRMRNRDWAAREQQSRYEMQQVPLPHQYSRGTPHPTFGNGSGSPMTQWLPPPGPPVGFDARRRAVHYGTPGVTPRMIRPTYAFNRVFGRGQPTMYANWPAQYYPGGSNTYIPSWEATGLIVKYTRQASYFRINKYLKELKVPKDQGFYLTLSGEDPYRVVSINDYRWEDSADAPGGREERQGFGFQPYRTARFCYPFSLGRKSVQQAEWPILAEHALMAACKAMTVRTQINTTLATTASGWTGTWGTNTSAASGTWSTSSETDLFIQRDISTGLIVVEQASGGIVTDEEALTFTVNPTTARAIARSPEYRNYIKGSPDALSYLTDHRNPNRKYQLAPQLYGLNLVVENAIRVTTPKPGNVPTPPSEARSYIWPSANAMISSKPAGIVQEGEQTVDFSTFAIRFFEQMTTESKSDPDNRREVGRVVEDFVCRLQAPQTGYLFTGVA